MKYILTLILMVTTLTANADSWTLKAPFGGGLRESAIGLSIGVYGYIGTGWSGSGDIGDFWRYDPSANSWTQMATFITANREAASCFEAGGKGYISTGSPNSNDLWEYDPAGNIWLQKTDFGGTARYGATAFSIGGKGYLGTGNSTTFNDDLWEYDPTTDAWTQKANITGGQRMWSSAFAINGYGYVSTGLNGNGKMNDLQRYDPVNNTWSTRAAIPGTARDIAVGFSVGNFGYIGTGRDGNGNTLNDFWEYDPVSDSWTQKSQFAGGAREWAVGFGIGSKGYLGTGGNGTLFSDFYEYSPDSTAVLPPVAQLAASDTMACAGQCIDFTDISMNSPLSWQWLFPGSSTATSTLQHPSNVCYLNPGSYDVTLIACNSLGCDTLMLTGYIQVSQAPVANITLSQDTLYSSPAASYQWFEFSTGLISGAAGPYYVIPQTGNYFVVITDSAGCTDTSSTVPYITSIEETGGSEIFSVWPNPFSSQVILNFGIHAGQVSINISDIRGRRVWSSNGHPIRKTKVLELGFLQPGVYMLSVEINGKREFKKLVRQ